MIIEQSIAGLIEEFKIPFKNSYCPQDWKDWYHYILYHPSTGIRILYNICFSGAPRTGFISDTFIITSPKGFFEHRITDFENEESFGFSRNLAWNESEVDSRPFSCHKTEVGLSINAQNSLFLRVTNKDACVQLHLYGKMLCNPIYVPELKPYGKGFMGWGVVPSYRMNGEIVIRDRYITINDDWYAYHDRNFGRFNWGNIGWTWFIARATFSENEHWTYIFHDSNKNDLTTSGETILILHRNNLLQKIFIGDMIILETEWTSGFRKPIILPGSMASVFNDRNIRSPRKIKLSAKDIEHEVNLELTVNSFFELIVPDNESKSYTFLKELSGSISITNKHGKQQLAGNKGFFYAELVH